MINISRTIIYLIIFVVGLTLGLIYNNIPYLTLDGEVGITDLANLLLAVTVAFLIPLSLSPIITNKRTIKDFLINETKDCIDFLVSIKSLIEKSSLAEEDSLEIKKKVNYMISTSLGTKISSLTEQLEASFEKQSGQIIKDIDDKYKEYWQATTGGELMAENFKFDITFCLSHDRNSKKLESCLKKTIHKINNYK